MKHHQTTNEFTLEEIPNTSPDDYEILGSFSDGGQRVIVVQRRQVNTAPLDV